jgi:hypothetical protein
MSNNYPFPPSNPFGTDFWIGGAPSGILDGDPSLRVATGRGLLTQRLLCRLSAPRGSYIDCPNDCIDLRDSLSAGMTQADIADLGSEIRDEFLKEEQVTDAEVNGTFSYQTSALTLSIAVESAYGPFLMVLLVTSVTVQLLNSNLLSPLP